VESMTDFVGNSRQLLKSFDRIVMLDILDCCECIDEQLPANVVRRSTSRGDGHSSGKSSVLDDRIRFNCASK